MDSKKLALLCRELADNKKAENIIVLDVRKTSSVTDYFVLVTGSSEPHLRAIINEITDGLREQHQLRPRTEGEPRDAWQVLDYFDVIVHVMRTDARDKYDLESLWGDAPRVLPAKEKAAKAEKPTKVAKAKPVKAVKAAKTVKPAAKKKAVRKKAA